jgi:hypothetical protein
MHLIVAPQLSGDWQHNYSTKASQAGSTNELSIYSLMPMVDPIRSFLPFTIFTIFTTLPFNC